MLTGAHVVVYSKDAAADRAFFRDVLGFDSVDAGRGSEISKLAGHGVSCSPVESAPWGSFTTVRLPGGSEVGLYQPKHPTAIPAARG